MIIDFGLPAKYGEVREPAQKPSWDARGNQQTANRTRRL